LIIIMFTLPASGLQEWASHAAHDMLQIVIHRTHAAVHKPLHLDSAHTMAIFTCLEVPDLNAYIAALYVLFGCPAAAL
jgi:hypothetical protein